MAEADALVPVSIAYRPYVLEMSPADEELDGTAMTLALVVITRESGMLIAVPSSFFAEDTLQEAMNAGPDDLLGPSTLKTLPAATVPNLSGDAPPPQTSEEEVDVLFIDVLPELAANMSICDPSMAHWDVVHYFHPDRPEIMPCKDQLLRAAWDWVLAAGPDNRVQFYSADEMVPECPAEEEEDEELAALQQVAPPVQPVSNGPSSTTGGRKPTSKAAAPKPKKQTVASLAQTLEGLTIAIPALTAQLTDLSVRTQQMEESMQGGSRASALRQPIGSLGIGGSSKASPPISSLLQEMPPPRTAKAKLLVGATGQQTQVEQLEAEREETMVAGSTDLTRAVLAQSTALTTLVGQIAALSGDPMVELGGGASSLSSRGASGRARLQQELASQKGIFFTSIFQAMSRRMSPATSSSATPMELQSRGITATRYLERYGGYGKCKDIGHIMWQVCLILDHLQVDNLEAAKDAAALLAVCLEQTALDNGQMDVGLLLALVEDPPASVFSNRSVAPLSRGRAFAPMAEQRWVTTALTFIKELDTINNRRADAVGTSSRPSGGPGGGDPPQPKAKAKKQPKTPWRKNPKTAADGEDQ